MTCKWWLRYQWTNEVVIWLFFLCIMHYLTPQTSSWQWLEIFYIAYFLVHSLANSWYFDLSVLYSLKMKDKKLLMDDGYIKCDLLWKVRHLAISGTRGSSGLGSQSKEQIESSTFEMVRAGDHWDLECDVNKDRSQCIPWFHLRMSRQIDPLELMLGW